MAQVIDNRHGSNAQNNDYPAAWARVPSLGVIIAVLTLAGLIIGSVTGIGGGSGRMFFQAYMYGWIFWMAITVGCFTFQLLTNITRATWGFPVLRLFEAGAKMMPFMGLLLLPILFNVFSGAHSIYPWADYAAAHADDKMAHRYLYMNPTAWALRNFIYFGLYTGIAYLLAGMSADQDRTRSVGIIQRRVNLASVSFVLYVTTGTLAYVDWVMSLDPHWYSTIYGIWFLAGGSLTALSFIVILASTQKLQNHRLYEALVTPKLTRDWGNLTLTLVMVWGYFSVSQFIITWSGNLPEEITYYIQRNNGTTAYITTFLVTGMFFIPFVCLLSGRTKRVPSLLRAVAMWIFGLRILEAFWNIAPFYPRNLHTELLSQLNWGYLWALFGIGGLWLFGFFTIARRSPLVPVEDVVAGEVAAHGA